MESKSSRRSFLKNSLLVTGGILITPTFISCSEEDPEIQIAPPLQLANFNQGVASFDPTASSVIIWTRYTAGTAAVVKLFWEISTDIDFKQIVRQGNLETDASRDYTLAIEVQDLPSNQAFYYRFYNPLTQEVSVIGETITLPLQSEAVSQLKLAVCSCANYAAGLFTVYAAMANSDVDVIIHLGDYIYEYAVGEYGTNSHTASLGREHAPKHEIITLADYRNRYKQYRGDADLKLAHQKKPFITVWDDHEIANDTYKSGAENHQTTEGSFAVRKQVALQAYSEYIPLKTGKDSRINRDFHFGNLVSLYMLDTRVIARDKQLNYGDYFTANGSLDAVSFQKDLFRTDRQLLGMEQLSWLGSKISSSNAKWQVLGQQVLMTKMLMPAELLLTMTTILAEIDALGSARPETFQQFQKVASELVAIKLRVLAKDPSLTPAEKARVSTVMPYNLDAWDGYPAEREKVYAMLNGKKIVALAGDTHNGWKGKLKDASNNTVGVEFATSSVTSPGLETYLGIGDAGASMIANFQDILTILIDDLDYTDLSKRGYLKTTFTSSEVKAEWFYASSVFVPNGGVLNLEKTVVESF
ncbi:alkaline phosphatase D family protein [Flavobacterium crassostreae]|uniref:Alkaline phosphatase n=1 Tax=Flavobacterium crassostreae TaxID=1763534 RepID=A0A1B9EA79_9FLAO|nr:alkaline phosphatase D family protein [Flavobacterium crassostreae]OCB78798.1 alkaline phosphatase [Flavobacterium crassostreae]